MSESKQTEALTAKSPWYVSGTRTRHNAMPVLQIVSEPTGEVLALVPYSDRTPKAHAECYADARLIAAAPELLAVAKAALAFIDSHVADPDITEEMVSKYNALRLLEPHDVFAKAEGR